MPAVIAIEVSPWASPAWATVFALAAMCDLTPESRGVVRGAFSSMRCGASRSNNSSGTPRLTRAGLKRLTERDGKNIPGGSLAARGRLNAMLYATPHSLRVSPDFGVAILRTLTLGEGRNAPDHASAESLGCLFRARLGDEGFNSRAYRRSLAAAKVAGRLAEATVAAVGAHAFCRAYETELRAKTKFLPALIRAERRWRAAEQTPMVAFFRSLRRLHFPMPGRADAWQRIYRAYRPLAIERGHLSPWILTRRLVLTARSQGHIAAGTASALLRNMTNAGCTYPAPSLRDSGISAEHGGSANQASGGRERVLLMAQHFENNDWHAALASWVPTDLASGRLLFELTLGAAGTPLPFDTESYRADRGGLIPWIFRTSPPPPSAEVACANESPVAATNLLCVRTGEATTTGRAYTAFFLTRQVLAETNHVRRMVVGVCAARAAMGVGKKWLAAKALARAVVAWRAVKALGWSLPAGMGVDIMKAFPDMCRQVAAAIAPRASSKDPVALLVRLHSTRAPRRKRGPVMHSIAALDAIVTAGRTMADHSVRDRIVTELARLVRARVLLHYADGRYHQLLPQSSHTLSSWSIRCLVRERKVRKRRVRRRPEFWLPEQRRPRGLLSFPIGDGTACLARQRPFTAREVETVRTLIRFLEARISGDPASRDPARDRLEAAGTADRVATPGGLAIPRGMVGEAPTWRRVLDAVWKVAPTSVPVLLLGETGTGKEVTARAIHLTSNRSQRPFVAASCATLRGDTLLSELFGHVRGAFSGAHRNHRGLFEQAHRGTLFLDELAEAPYELQVALLRVLEDGVVRPVGSVGSRRVDVRLVAATNQDLETARAGGRFRDDLFHRLSGFSIDLPPLRERLSDLPALVDHLLARHAPGRRVHRDGLALLEGYEWPGNIRELENVLRASAFLCDDIEIPPEALRRILGGRRESTRREALGPPLGPRAARLLEAMRIGWWAAPELANRLGVSVRTVNRDLESLVESEYVELVGMARGRRYRRRRV